MPCLRPLLALLALACASAAAADSVQLVSRVDPGDPSVSGSASSFVGSGQSLPGTASNVSADGRWIAYNSLAMNLVDGQVDAADTSDTFLTDRATGATLLVSRTAASATTAGNGSSHACAISTDGRFVLFASDATDLVPGQNDTNGAEDVFLYDRIGGVTVLVSRSTSGAAKTGNAGAWVPVMSADGGRVAFLSDATDLVSGQSSLDNGHQIFLFDRAAGTTAMVSHAVGSPTTPGSWDSFDPSLSADGTLVAYVSRSNNLATAQSDTNSDFDVFVYSAATGGSVLVSHVAGSTNTAAGSALEPVISGNGNRIVFSSAAGNLVSGQTGASTRNVFLYTRASNTSALASHALADTARGGNSDSQVQGVSADGEAVTFVSHAGDLVVNQITQYFYGQVYLYRRGTGVVTLVSRNSTAATQPGNDESYAAQVSADGGQVAFLSRADNLPAAATAFSTAAYLFDAASGALTLVSRAPGFGSVDGIDLSADGRWAVFSGSAPEVAGDRNAAYDVFAYDRTGVATTLVSAHAPGSPALSPSWESSRPSLGNDGSSVVFLSQAQDLVAGENDVNTSQTDAYLWSRATGAMTLISHAAGAPSTTGDASVMDATMSGDGDWVLYTSAARNVVPGQTGENSGTYLWERTTENSLLVTRSNGSPVTPAQGGSSTAGSVSRDGRWVALSGGYTDLVPGMANPSFLYNVFLFDRATGAMTLVSHAAGQPTTAGNWHSGIDSVPGISADGRFVVFESSATNLLPGQSGTPGEIAHVFLYDRTTGALTLVSHAAGAAGTPANGFCQVPRISADGGSVAFLSVATNLVSGQVDPDPDLTEDLFLWDRATGAITLVSHAHTSAVTAANDLTENAASLSADGRFVAYTSWATNLAPVTTSPGHIPLQVWLWDRATGANTLVSHSTTSPTRMANDQAGNAVISADGRAVTFTSSANDLAPGQEETYDLANLFLWDRAADATFLVSRAGSPSVSGGAQAKQAVSSDGAHVAFVSGGPLAPGDFNALPDVYLFSRDLPGADFFTLTPCRLLDTRRPEDGPALASGSREILALAGACGIPATARAVVLNVTAVDPTGQGNLRLHPGDTGLPAASTLNFRAGETRANLAILRLALDGEGTLAVSPSVAGGGTVHVIVDVTGWFE
jgi:hypothetical protein